MIVCEANVYLQTEDGKEDLFLDAVDQVIPQDDGKIFMENIYGERRTIAAKIKKMELVDHKIYLESNQPLEKGTTPKIEETMQP